MIIRKAKKEDIPGINTLLYQVLMVHHYGRPDLFKPNTKKYNDDELFEIINDDHKVIFVATDENDTILGYAFTIHQQIFNSNVLTDIKTLYIDDLCVEEKLRGQHIGTKLYEYVIDYAKANQYYNVTLNVWTCNPSALKFYEKLGLLPQKIGMEVIL